MDGKTLRRSFDRAAGRSPLHVVTAFSARARISLGQRAVAPSENGIAAARTLLATLALDCALVTADAIHSPGRDGAAGARARRRLPVRAQGQPPRPLEAVAAFFADPPEALACFETANADHGRVEHRRHWATHSVDWLFGDRAEPGAPRMPGLATLACVKATRNGGTPCRRYYLSSARLTAERFAGAIRSHWTIENSLHRVLDVTFNEDAARNRKDNGPKNLVILRRLTLNLLQTARPNLPHQ